MSQDHSIAEAAALVSRHTQHARPMCGCDGASPHWGYGRPTVQAGVASAHEVPATTLR